MSLERSSPKSSVRDSRLSHKDLYSSASEPRTKALRLTEILCDASSSNAAISAAICATHWISTVGLAHSENICNTAFIDLVIDR